MGTEPKVVSASSSNVAISSFAALVAGFIDSDAKTRHGLMTHAIIPEKRKIKVNNRMIDLRLLTLTIVIPSSYLLFINYILLSIGRII